MNVHELIQQLLKLPQALEVVVPNPDEPRQWDSQIVTAVRIDHSSTGRCKNCQPGCRGDKFLHAGADSTGPCTARGCNPACTGWEAEIKKVVVIE